MTNFNFTDRTTYLTWRAEWKASYKQLSADIRAAKRANAETARTWSKATQFEARDKMFEFYKAHATMLKLRAEANKSLETLTLAKEAAGKAHAENKERSTVNA